MITSIAFEKRGFKSYCGVLLSLKWVLVILFLLNPRISTLESMGGAKKEIVKIQVFIGLI